MRGDDDVTHRAAELAHSSAGRVSAREPPEKARYARAMRVHHLAFRTGDLERLERFFVDALGLAVLRRNEARSVWLDAGGTIVMLEMRDAGEPALVEGTKELAAFAVDPDTRAFYTDRLARVGVPIEASTDFTLYVRDPDGRRIGLSSYPEPLR
jgi:catechol 2,3-dioxygenase-like lactoylglutathione lyase family enzyme